ncbi:MAG: plastocyanin/azurin family copper-binding protein [Bacteroidetes bacterium]|nr:plastocyanin/azurin family copper-binding protein [Bacteroidota bacterium]MCY4204652.1 plastocyanin/azurin family copper-binding protein [Bacteroidota bacterium]
MKSLLFSVLCLFVALTFVACGGGDTTYSEVAESSTELTGSEIIVRPAGEQMKFEVDSINVSVGQEVTLILENIATLPTMVHNVVILTSNSEEDANRVGMQAIMAGEAKGYLPEDEAILAATPMAQPGETVQVTFTAPSEPGVHLFICTYPGHYAAMRGVLVVS